MISSPGTGLQGPDGTCGYSVRMAECGPVFELACCVDEAGTLANSSRQFRLDVFLCIREKNGFHLLPDASYLDSHFLFRFVHSLSLTVQ